MIVRKVLLLLLLCMLGIISISFSAMTLAYFSGFFCLLKTLCFGVFVSFHGAP